MQGGLMQACIDILYALYEFARNRPILACFIIIAVIAGTAGIIHYVIKMIDKYYRTWFIPLGQTVPLTMALFFFNFVLTLFGNYVLLVILFVFVVFLFLAIYLHTFGKTVILIMGFIGIFLWLGLFYQFYNGVIVQQAPPAQQFTSTPTSSPPSAPIGRP